MDIRGIDPLFEHFLGRQIIKINMYMYIYVIYLMKESDKHLLGLAPPTIFVALS